jgi:hypothetical protein
MGMSTISFDCKENAREASSGGVTSSRVGRSGIPRGAVGRLTHSRHIREFAESATSKLPFHFLRIRNARGCIARGGAASQKMDGRPGMR